MTMATSITTLTSLPSLRKNLGLKPAFLLRTSVALVVLKRNQYHRLIVRGTTEGSAKSSRSDEKIPSWAKPDSDEPPPWVSDAGSGSSPQSTFQIPFYAYLLASAVTAIAAIGSAFEYVNQNPVFGVLNSDSVFYAPLLGFFAFSGIPTSAYLWYKSVQVANKEAEEQDRKDGFL